MSSMMRLKVLAAMMKTTKSSDTVTISKDEYDGLVAHENFLSCLLICGVDSWEGYDEAVAIFQDDDTEELDD